MSDFGKWEDEIICPWCGHAEMDSWEYKEYDGHEINCGECEKPMKLSVDFEVRYSTKKITNKEQNHEGE